MERTRARAALVIAFAASFGIVSAGAAYAVSGGGYDPSQQDCTPFSDNSATPPNTTEPGCHNLAVNVESGGTTNGNPNPDNVRFAEVGLNQEPNNPRNPSFGTLYNLGDPGTPDGIHSGCVAANTAGTGGGPGTGCGSNPKGAGFSLAFDYYQVYCPATAPVPLDSVPWPGRLPNPDPTGMLPLDPPGLPAAHNCSQPYGPNAVSLAKGTDQQLTSIATNGMLVYFGMDDNNDNGEHDGFNPGPCQPGTGGSTGKACVPTNTNAVGVGASDGGAVTLSMTPKNATNAPTGHNPEGLVNASSGFCADGICAAGTTQQQTVYYGCDAPGTPPGTPAKPGGNGKGSHGGRPATPGPDQCAPGQQNSSGDVYRNQAPSSTQESPNCQSGNATIPSACYTNNPGGPNAYRAATPHRMNVEPGVQTYQDPDPQRSPAAPFGMPGAYVGTCGLYANGGTSTVGPSPYDYATGQISSNGGPAAPAIPTTGSNHTIVDQPSGLC